MKHLVLAILKKEDADRAGLASGVDGQPLEFVAEGLLAAACSLAPAANAAPEVGQLLAYARVVHDLFQQVTVLPMRYGCWLDSARELQQLLSRNEAAFRACLQQVDDCVEMGIRILSIEADSPVLRRDRIPTPAPLQEPLPMAAAGERTARSSARAGVNYLLARKSRYAGEDGRRDAFERVTQRIQHAFTGLFVKSVAEQHGAGQGGYWSLYFLVRREAGERFRAAYRELEGALPDKLLLTGPWPPYNFVAWRTQGLSL